jgi:mannitol/fructose-specific phosphotransferase system IIA component (Ntr-type)
MGHQTCDIKLSLLSQLLAATDAHAHQSALLSAIAMSGNHDEFSEALERCGGIQRMYEAAKKSIEKHQQEHGC